MVATNGAAVAFVKDDKTFANVIRGRGSPRRRRPISAISSVDYSEFWLILEGKIDPI